MSRGLSDETLNKGDLVIYLKYHDRVPEGTVCRVWRWDTDTVVEFLEPMGGSIGWGKVPNHPHGFWSVPRRGVVTLYETTSNITEPSEDIYNDLI